ncbi:MAG: sugar ABC transporter ATP-binding protein [Acidobacteria bacterium]|nr:sugar ABC transporter ATP-binding protein [Acidobacteriota bacterium]MCW5971184.1 sugar ABC transporter ATP-binding protein [Blastocatellales bacterium]
MTDNPLLHAAGLSKAFAGVQALDGASFELRSGEVHALVGENGAGKSTLIRIITGAIEADEGSILLDGETLSHLTPQEARRRGIAAIYQQPQIFPELSAAENIALGCERGGLWRLIDRSARRRRAGQLLERIGARFSPDAIASDLTMPEQQLLEIARAIGADARLLIMDEPTASLTEADVENLFRVIGELRDGGAGVIYISHRLEELPVIADRVTVLRDGRTIATRAMPEIDRRELIRLMVGRELSAVFPKREIEPGVTALELRGAGCTTSGVSDVTLELRAGEILGLAGLVGAGRTELARMIFGLTPADEGEIRVHGEGVRIESPADAIRLGIAYVPEDRRRHGVIAELPVRANTTLAALDEFSRYGFLDLGRERDTAAEYVARLGIKTASVDAEAATLSGGNQQKVALGRWLATKPAVLILDEPTQGIDIGAKAEIHRLMGDLAAEGMAILMISSEMPEILGMSDRIAVMRGGRIVGLFDRAEATPERVLELALKE